MPDNIVQARPVVSARLVAIFPDRNIPCPRCGYNLRMLNEPRCPECGLMFDPAVVEQDFEAKGLPPPSARQIVRGVYRHPIAFWRSPRVRASRGPTLWQILLFSLLSGLLVFALMFVHLAWHAYSCGCSGMPSGNATWSLRYAAGYVFYDRGVVFVVGMAVLAVAQLLLIQFHRLACWALLRLARWPRSRLAASTAVGCSSACQIVAVPSAFFFAGAAYNASHAGKIAGAGASPLSIWVLIAAASLVVGCGLWAVCLVCGLRACSRPGWVLPILCMVLNPFWYVLALLAWAVQ